MRLFSNPERALAKKLDRALAAGNKGDFAQSARLYGEAAADAATRLGPEDPVVLTAREDAAVAYLQSGDLRRGRDLLSALIPEMERAPALGPDNRYTINARLSLAGSYGEEGDHAKVRELLIPEVERAERALGPSDKTTFNARESLATAERELAQGELDRLLALEPRSGDAGATVDRAVWEPRVSRATSLIRQPGSYRSKRVLEGRSPDGDAALECVIEVTENDDLRVLQTIHEGEEDLYDLWVVVDGERYQNVGAWLDTSNWSAETKAENRNVDDSLKLSGFLDVVKDEPAGVSAYRVGGEEYWRLEYRTVPSFARTTFGDQEPTNQDTVLWIDEHERVAKAEVAAEADQLAIRVRQAFASFGEPLMIAAPPREILVSASQNAD